jgi:sugar phosphate permease
VGRPAAALPTNCRYGVMALLAGMICINYVDRFNIAAAVPTLMKEFSLSPARMGMLMSAFGWTYLICMLPVGYLLNRKSPKKVGYFSCLGWGIATLLTAAVSGFYSFFAVRLALGATEAAGYPTCTRIAAAWTPKHERTTATGIFDCSSKLGSALTPPFVVWTIMHWGWRYSFIVTGLVAIAFAFVWRRFYHDPEKHPTVSQEELDYIRQGQMVGGTSPATKTKEIPIYKLLSYPRIFLMCCGFFLYMYFATVFHMWIPAYLVHARGFNLKSMGIVATFPYLAGIGGELIGARLLDKWLERGASLTKVRRTGQLVGLFGAATCLYLTIAASSPAMTVFWMTASYTVLTVCGAQNWAIASELAPRDQVGSVAALNGMSGALAVTVAPILSGLVIQTRWGYDGALFVVVGAVVVSGILYGSLNYNKPVVPRS